MAITFINMLFWIVGCIIIGIATAMGVELFGHKTLSKGIMALTSVVAFGSIIYLMYNIVADIVSVFNLR